MPFDRLGVPVGDVAGAEQGDALGGRGVDMGRPDILTIVGKRGGEWEMQSRKVQSAEWGGEISREERRLLGAFQIEVRPRIRGERRALLRFGLLLWSSPTDSGGRGDK